MTGAVAEMTRAEYGIPLRVNVARLWVNILEHESLVPGLGPSAAMLVCGICGRSLILESSASFWPTTRSTGWTSRNAGLERSRQSRPTKTFPYVPPVILRDRE